MMTSTFTTSPETSTLTITHKSVLDIMAYSSAFWAAGILESSKIEYNLLKSSIPMATFFNNEDTFIGDGGLVDTTGIVSHLQRKVNKIVAFYDNNSPLR